MEYNSNIDKQINSYSELFDIYMDRGKVPEQYVDDPLSQYMQSQVEGYRAMVEKDEDIRELLRERLLGLYEKLLPGILEIQEGHKDELARIRKFFGAGAEEKRQQWPRLRSWLTYNYPKDVFNAEGYAGLFSDSGIPDSRLLEAMRYNWESAAALMKCRRLESLTQSRLRKRMIGIGRQDYEDRRKLRATAFRYPELKDILQQIGREKEAGSEEKDITELVNIPILLRHSTSKQEIDGVTVGNNLTNLLPSEYALIDEPVFFKKYVDHQLQQFKSKPPTVFRQKTEKHRRPEPRLESGPIILAIDTSLSMAGKPLDISHALLTQIIYLARRQRRKCFLITFSVRARHMEVSRPGQYTKVEEFFSRRLTGGTDGEEMLGASFKALQKGNFSMADILIISDFIFPMPKKATAAKIQEEKLRGTRFYGLYIGSSNSGPGGYDKILDKYWKISV